MIDKKASTKKVDNILTKIWQLFEAEKIDEAYKIAEKTVKLFPDNSQLNYILGLIHYDKSDYQKALYCFTNAKKFEKESKRKGFIDYWIGRTYEHDNWSGEIKNPVFDKNKALLAYKSAKEHTNFPADTILKLVRHTDKDYERVNLYEFGIEKFPTIIDFYIRLSQLQKQIGYPSKQLQCLLKGEENGLKSSSIYFNLGNYFFNIKNYEKSKEYYLKSLEINENERALDCLYYVLGNTCFKLKEYSLSIEYYKKSVDACKNDSSSWYGILGLIEVYDKLKKNSEIIKLFDTLIIGKELFEDISFGYVMMAYFDSEVMEDIEFRQDLKQVILVLKKIKWEAKSKELHLKVLLLYEAIYSHLNLHKERLMVSRKTLDFSNTYYFLEEKLQSAYLSNIESNNDLKETVMWFMQDKSSISHNAVTSILSSLIKKLAQLKEYDKIVQLANDFNSNDLVNADILFEYAYALSEEGNVKESKKNYEKYLEIHPRSTASLNNLGVIFKGEGNYEKATSLYKQAIKFDNQNELYQNNLKIATELLVKKQKDNKLKKIPENWVAMKSFTVDNFEEIEYFSIIDKIEKINKKYRTLIERDFKELVFNYVVKNYKSIIVLSGSLVELILTYFCEKNKIKTIPIKNSKGIIIHKRLYDCVLSELILFVDSKKHFGNDFQHLSNLSRIYRNFIHPGLEIKNKDDIKSKGDLCFISTREILKKILNY